MDDKMRALIGMGVAFATGALSSFEEHVKNAKEHGAKAEELNDVLVISRAVKLTGSMEMDSFADGCINRSPKTQLKILTTSNAACDCGPEGCC